MKNKAAQGIIGVGSLILCGAERGRMGEKKDELKPDTVLKNYWKQKEEFADFFNAYLFGGREVLKAEELEERDTDSATVLSVEDADKSVRIMGIRSYLSCFPAMESF